MTQPVGSVKRQLVAFQHGFGQESKQDTAFTNLQENMTDRLTADYPEAK